MDGLPHPTFIKLIEIIDSEGELPNLVPLDLEFICSESYQNECEKIHRQCVRCLARISHTFSEQIAALPIEIASQVGEDSVRATRPRPLERQDHRAGCASCQRKCEKCGLKLGRDTLSREEQDALNHTAWNFYFLNS
jgi:hypothetical protein